MARGIIPKKPTKETPKAKKQEIKPNMVVLTSSKEYKQFESFYFSSEVYGLDFKTKAVLWNQSRS